VIKATHETFEAMAEAIFKAAEDPDFPGIVPWDSPADMLCGYIKAAPRSKRTHEDQWCCPIMNIRGRERDPEMLGRLRELCERGRTSHEQ